MTCFPVYEWLSPDDAQHWPHDVFEAKAPWRSCRMAVRGSWRAWGSRPVTVKASPDQVVELVESWVTAKNQTHNAVLEKRVEKDSAYLHARCVTPTVGFADDLFVRTTELNQGTLVEVQSGNRVGGHDMEANYRRCRALLAHLQKQTEAGSCGRDSPAAA